MLFIHFSLFLLVQNALHTSQISSNYLRTKLHITDSLAPPTRIFIPFKVTVNCSWPWIAFTNVHTQFLTYGPSPTPFYCFYALSSPTTCFYATPAVFGYLRVLQDIWTHIQLFSTTFEPPHAFLTSLTRFYSLIIVSTCFQLFLLISNRFNSLSIASTHFQLLLLTFSRPHALSAVPTRFQSFQLIFNQFYSLSVASAFSQSFLLIFDTCHPFPMFFTRFDYLHLFSAVFTCSKSPALVPARIFESSLAFILPSLISEHLKASSTRFQLQAPVFVHLHPLSIPPPISDLYHLF